MLLESSALKWRISQTQLICLEETYIFQDLDCQPRSDSCLAEAVGRGWTVRPRLDSPDRGKCKFSQGKSIESERFSTSDATTFKQHGFIFYAF